MTAAAGVDRRPPGARQALVLISAPLFAMLGALLVAPLLSTIEASFRDTPHADVLVPMLLTAPALFLALLSPVAGLVGERLGPRRLLLWSLGVYGLLGMAPIFLQSLYAILASRLLVGVAEAGLVTSALMLLSRYFSGDERQKWLAYQNAYLPWIGAAMIALIGVIGNVSWRATFAMYGLALVALVAAALVLVEAEPELDHDARAPGGKTTQVRKLPWRTLLHICAIAVPR